VGDAAKAGASAFNLLFDLPHLSNGESTSALDPAIGSFADGRRASAG
jgi:hypothetical protein